MSVDSPLRVVIAEGDPTLAQRIRATLRLYWPGARFAIVHSGPEAVEAVSQERVDLFILDPRLSDRPVHGGRRVRPGLSRVPTVVLVASEDEARRDDVAGGRDAEYVVTPFSPLELLARTRAVLQQAREEPVPHRRAPRRRRWFADGYLSVDFVRRRAWVNRALAYLTPIEFRLLTQLVGRAGRVVPPQTLLASVLGPEGEDATDFLWAYVRRLREKIEPDPDDPRYVLTEPGTGYRFGRPASARRTPPTARGSRLAVLRRVPGRGAVLWGLIAGSESGRSRRCSRPADRSAGRTGPSSRRRIRRKLPDASLVAVGTPARP
jgi:two-component system, OmpR family, KDP operon response regulator KdpE